ncbi:MAG: hypothetical protein JXA03_06485 [Bacteroidales bacterium]|nr:hypothetical protein [Bacteroidales bacterium]
MKRIYKMLSILLVIVFSAVTSLHADVITYPDSWGKDGFNLSKENTNSVTVVFSVSEVFMENVDIDGLPMKSVHIPGVLLPNDEGAPDLPGTSRFIAIPQGATARYSIIAARTEILSGVEIAPAPRIPLDSDNGPLFYEKNSKIYTANEFYPAEPVKVSEPTQIRGLDVVYLGITPFQYNPVTKELIIYKYIEVEVEFIGGNGRFGEDRLRSRWFDPILYDAVLNFNSLPEIDYDKPREPTETLDYEYLIIVPNDATFISWADSVKRWRNLQGIRTGVVTTTQIGSNNATQIENYINNAINTWAVPPVAVLLIGDYGTSGSTIVSPIYNSYCVSDNIYADVTGNHLPDLILARMTAQNATHLNTMIGKFLKYERTPPTNPNFYNHPITALGWQTERWFQICSETVGGFWKNVMGKNPVRINAIYSGSPGSVWSTATNTSTVVNLFGPNGLGYIPATPSALGGWSGGTASQVNTAVNNGAFMLQHRDHGSTTGWGEPSYSSSNINGLTNTDLTWVFSINCLTGKYNLSGECFTEKFHRYTYNGQFSGALGLTAASEVSYSFVNDTYVWGMFDNMWPGFLPEYGTTFGNQYILPSFGNAAGKIFLAQSSWPYNTNNKQVTYHLFHHHGDAFTTVYSEVPVPLSVSHASTLTSSDSFFPVTATFGSLIALTVNGEILGTAIGNNNPVNIPIPQLNIGDIITVTVTKQNYYRYTGYAEVLSPMPRFALKAFLEGPFNGTEMYKFLNTYGHLPLSQPFNTSPWYYTGTESVASIPNGNVVDWVLVELRETSGSSAQAVSSTGIGRMAGFILNNGDIVGIDGASPLEFNYPFSQNVYAVVYHRNHLPVMSNYPLQENQNMYTYDFTNAPDKVCGGVNGHKLIAPGVWGMVSSDGDSDGQITSGDKVEVWGSQVGLSGYMNGDFNMNGNTDNTDKIQYWAPNAGYGMQVPQ